MMNAKDESGASPQRDGGSAGYTAAFRELYAVVTREARALGRPDAPDPEAVKHRLLAALAHEAAELSLRLGDQDAAEHREAQYVMVAMADEVLLQRPWSGRDAWADHPLEAEPPFCTHVAGERVFARLDEILAGRATVSVALVRVYLTALGLGFRGRYRFDPRSPEPDRYRRELTRYLRRVEPAALAPRAALCPGALEGVADKQPRRGLRSLREGLLPLLAVVAVMLFAGHALWYVRTMGVRAELDRVDDARAELEQRAAQREKAKRPDGAEVSAR